MDEAKNRFSRKRHRRAWPLFLLLSILLAIAVACRPPEERGRPAATETPIPPTAAPSPSPTPGERGRPAAPETPATVEQVLDRLVREVNALRGLSLTETVPYAWMSRDGLRAFLERHLAEEYPAEKAELDAQVMALLGLLEPDTDLYRLMLDLYTEQIAGMYDTRSGRMYLIAEALGPLEQLVFVHEYTHALQDRLFGLGRQLDALREDDDRSLALEALAEGDATLLMEQYLLAHMSELMTPDLLDQVYGLETPRFDAAPYAIQQQLMFPYEAGLTFVWTLHAEGNWARVNAVWKDPPRSTEQILHPERYPEDSPQAVAIPPLTTTLGAGWRLRGQNTLGEFMLRLHLGVYLDEEEVDRAATGWDGDRYALYRRENGETCLVLALVWDDEQEADEFVEIYRDLAETRYGTAGKGTAEEGIWWAGRPGLYLKQRGQTVWLILSPERTTAEAVVRELHH